MLQTSTLQLLPVLRIQICMEFKMPTLLSYHHLPCSLILTSMLAAPPLSLSHCCVLLCAHLKTLPLDADSDVGDIIRCAIFFQFILLTPCWAACLEFAGFRSTVGTVVSSWLQWLSSFKVTSLHLHQHFIKANVFLIALPMRPKKVKIVQECLQTVVKTALLNV